MGPTRPRRFWTARRLRRPDGHLVHRPLWNAHRVRIVPAEPGSVEETARMLYLALHGQGEVYGPYASFYARRVLMNGRGGGGIGALVLILGFLAVILLLSVLGLSWLHTFGLP